MVTPSSRNHDALLAHRVRCDFVDEVSRVLPALESAVMDRLLALNNAVGNSREMQDRADALREFETRRAEFAKALPKAWQAAIAVMNTAAPRATGGDLLGMGLSLVDHDELENKIVWSRLAQGISEKITWELGDLRTRIQHLEGADDLLPEDILRPEVLSRIFIEQWSHAGLSRNLWQMVLQQVQQELTRQLTTAYTTANQTLVDKGVLPEIDFKSRVKRAPSGAAQRPAGEQRPDGSAGVASGGGAYGPAGDQSGAGAYSGGGGSAGGFGGGASGAVDPAGSAAGVGGGWAAYAPGVSPGAAQGAGAGAGAGAGGAAYGSGAYGGQGRAAQGGGAGGGYGGGGGVAGGGGARTAQGRGALGSYDDPAMAGLSPLARARSRAQAVMGQLKRLLIDRVAEFDMTRPSQPSSALAQAMQAPISGVGMVSGAGLSGGGGEQATVLLDLSLAGVARTAAALKEKSTELKEKANTQSEKATIEIVALMFQSILAEDRIPPSIRVWFARLQMPVLRVALAEPEFFGTTQHPARRLIDHMGSCVMGFDASTINGSALEAEIRRVVQVIEQYPETGRRVYQLVYDEFQKFLAKYLTQQGPAQKVVSVAQQVEQKEALSIKYTIELRNMLKNVPVRDEIREFLFKVWADVLAIAAVKNGAQHESTLMFKKCATDLVWAASAKPNRNDRARVIQDLPALLQRLRSGMAQLGMAEAQQEASIKTIGDTLADAFMSKTEAIPQDQIEAMAKRLSHLEDFFTEDGSEDAPLDAETIEMMVGIDASSIDIIAAGGAKPSDAMLSWARELQPGAWFTLDHNGKVSQVQYAWASERRQLHLFASPDGRSSLFQVNRLAAYLEVGLLVPQEEEALTVRATRDALARLDANPERLLK